MSNIRTNVTARLVTLFVAVTLLAATAWAQSSDKPPAGSAQPSSSSPTNTKEAGQGEDATERPMHMPDYSPVSADERLSHLFLTSQSPLHWGHLNVLSFSFSQSYQNNTETAYNNSILRGDLNYSVARAGVNFAVAYAPSVWFSHNGVRSNLSNHHLDLATDRKWGRWVFGLTDSFYSLPLESQFSQFGFVDTGSYGRTMDPSLVTGDTLSNHVHVTADRLLGPSDRVQLSLGYLYNRVSNQINGLASTPTQNTGDVGLSWNHTLGWRSSFGATYRYTRSYYSGNTGFSHHHAVVGTYSLQPKRGWDVALSFGPTYWMSPQNDPRTTYLANVAVTRRFTRSTISLTAGRSDEFIGLIGDTLTNSAGLSFDHGLTRKWHVTAGGNYVREVAGRPSHSWRAWNQTSYTLARNWSATLGYSFFQQTNVTTVKQLPSHFVTAGIRWSWSPERR